jgi:lycopene cyclase domain-containing protein
VTYWALNAIFLAAVAAVVIATVIVRRGPVWASVGLTGVAVLLLTAVFDNVMIGVGLVGYDRKLISGAFVGIAPLEDFAYAIAAALLLPALWSLLGKREKRKS